MKDLWGHRSVGQTLDVCVGRGGGSRRSKPRLFFAPAPPKSAGPADPGQGLWRGRGPVDNELPEDAALPPGAF